MDDDAVHDFRLIAEIARRARERYSGSHEWTVMEDLSCTTIRVPMSLLNRIRDLEEELEVQGAKHSV